MRKEFTDSYMSLKSYTLSLETAYNQMRGQLQYNNAVAAQTAELARQARIANAFSIINAMKVQPYQLPQPLVFPPAPAPVNRTINCLSNTNGSTTSTTCQ